jgi:DNA-binding transcriptional LysR family regulator
MDPLENLLDVVIRIGRIEDSSYVIRKLGSLRRGLYAAPGYFKGRRIPEQPQDLTEHSLIATERDAGGAQWKLRHRDGREDTLQFDPQIAVPDPVLAHDLAGNELGIASLPEFVTHQGPPLMQVLEHWKPTDVEVVALYPARQFAPLKLKVFLQELEEKLQF